jgi:hypothetical protein
VAKATIAGLAAAKRLPVDLIKKFADEEYTHKGAKRTGVAFRYKGIDGKRARSQVRKTTETSDGNSFWVTDGDKPEDEQLPIVAFGSHLVSRWVNTNAPYVEIGEGVTDTLTAFYHKIPALGLPGATNHKLISLEHVVGFSSVLLAFDTDAAGENAVTATAKHLREIGYTGRILRLSPAPHKDLSAWHIACNGSFRDEWDKRVEEALEVPEPVKSSADGKARVEDPDEKTDDTDEDEEPRRSQTDAIIDLVNDLGVELAHDDNDAAYAIVTTNGRRETFALKSRSFRHWITSAFYDKHGRAPRAASLADAKSVLDAMAVYKGRRIDVGLRVAGTVSGIEIDLGGPDWKSVHVTADGWEIAPHSMFFRRSGSMLAIPEPAKGGRLVELRHFIRVDDRHWALLAAWIVSACRPDGPYPILGLAGEFGSAKTTSAKALVSLIDPSTSPVRSMPRDPRDIVISAQHAHVLAFDNVSSISADTSDALCRLATGGRGWPAHPLRRRRADAAGGKAPGDHHVDRGRGDATRPLEPSPADPA